MIHTPEKKKSQPILANALARAHIVPLGITKTCIEKTLSREGNLSFYHKGSLEAFE